MKDEIIEGEVKELVVQAEGQAQDRFLSVMSIDTAVERRESLVEFTKKIMVKDKDFGTIPGTNKPTLYKAGAEKLTTFFGLTPVFVPISAVEDWTGKDHGDEAFFAYRYKCQLFRGDYLIGEGIGSCNSWEGKYRFRNANLVCPQCGEEAVIKGKEEYGGGWLCWDKKGGCKAKWEDDDPVITGQERGKVPHDNPADLANTIDKMAQKRALVAATLIGVNASEFFTQDMEDIGNGAKASQAVPVTEQKQSVAQNPEKMIGLALSAMASNEFTASDWLNLAKALGFTPDGYAPIKKANTSMIAGEDGKKTQFTDWNKAGAQLIAEYERINR